MKHLSLLFSFTLSIAACSGGDDVAALDGGSTPTDGSTIVDGGSTNMDGGTTVRVDGGSTADPDGGLEPIETLTLDTGPIAVPAGVERTQCASFDLGNDTDKMIRAIRTHLSAGSHHMITYRLDEAPDPVFRNCGAFEHGVGSSLFIAQTREASIVYPPRAALPIHAHQTIGIEIHYINYVSTDPIDISGVLDVDLIDPDPSYRPVELLFLGELALYLPPRAMTTSASFQPIPAGVEIFAMTSHTHQYGILSTIHRGRSETMLGEELHRSTNWEEPPLDRFTPPVVLDPGEGLVLTCVYENTSDRTVTFGTGFEDEMCFLWAYVLR